MRKSFPACLILSILIFGFPCDTLAGTTSAAAPPKVLPSIEPDDKAAPVAVDVTVDWNKTIGTMSPLMWGVCDWDIMVTERAADPKYNEYLTSLRRPFIRVHGGIITEWVDPATKTWDARKIKAGFDAATTGYRDAVLMVCVSARVPGVKETDWGGFISPADEDRQARFTAEFVRIMRDEVKRKVDYWEFFNEWDGWNGKEGSWDKYGKLDDYWRLINKTATAIKNVDSGAKVGAAAFVWPNPAWIHGIVEHCGKNLDFISWHHYAVGSPYDSNEKVLFRVDQIAFEARAARKLIDQCSPTKKFPTFLSEYNMNWDYTLEDPRMRSSFGAVFDACLLKHLALAGIDGAAIWQVKNWLYGLIGDHYSPNRSQQYPIASNTLHPSGYLYQWGHAYLVGRIAETRISDETSADCLPIIAQNGKSLLFMNKIRQPVVIPRAKRLLIPGKGESLRVMVIDSKGLSSPPVFTNNSEDLRLRGYSVTLLTTILPEGGK
jgi:hypothetical protein